MNWIQVISPRVILLKRKGQLTVPVYCTADMSLIWFGSEGGVLCVLHTVLWVLISLLFCQGKASLPLSAADLADCSNCSFMSAFLTNVQSNPNLWKVSLVVTGIRCGFHFAPLTVTMPKCSTMPWLKWNLEKPRKLCPVADCFDQTICYTKLYLEFLSLGTSS